MLSNESIVLKNICKSFSLQNSKINILKKIFHLIKPDETNSFKALKNINLNIKKGESVGIIGSNGSGKSTLLQIICGTMNPDKGTVNFQGRIGAVLELGAGFNNDLTGLENIYISAALYGFTEDEINKKINHIIDFAEIGDFINAPVRTYSSGMYVRLAFAIIANIDADILIIDEALAVGDIIFTQKCIRFLDSFKKEGTLIFVSHDINSVRNLCSRVIFINEGSIQMDGKPKNVLDEYIKVTYHKMDFSENYNLLQNTRNRWKTNLVSIDDVKFLFKDTKKKVNHIEGGEPVSLIIKAKILEHFENPIIGWIFKDKYGQSIFGDNTLNCALKETYVKKGKEITGKFTFKFPFLQNGKYSLTVSVASGNINKHTQHDYIFDILEITVSSKSLRYGLIDIKCLHKSLKIN